MRRKTTRRRNLENLESRKMFAVLADIDLDGDHDIVSSATAGGLAWFENTDGQGNYERQAIATHEGDVKVFDMDQDGDGDLVTRSAWYEFADGSFERHGYGLAQANSAIPFDLGSDGDNDIVLTTNTGVVILENQTGASQLVASEMTLPDGVGCSAAGDIDGDGDVDCLAIEIDQANPFDRRLASLVVSTQEANGSFSKQELFHDAGDETWPTTYNLEVVDIDGDGALDAVVSSNFPQGYSAGITWHKNTGGNTQFADPQTIFNYTTSGRGDSLDFISDVDGDGDVDVGVQSVESYYTQGFYWLENNNGNFEPSVPIAAGGQFAQKFEAFGVDQAMGDVNGDGIIDRLAIDETLTWLDGAIDAPEKDIRIGAMQDALRNGTSAANAAFPADGNVTAADYEAFIEDVVKAPWGDSNLDGRFDTSDLVHVISLGEYEDNVAGNSTWTEGDWDGDGDFTTSDLTLVLAKGGYQQSVELDARFFDVSATGPVTSLELATDADLTSAAFMRGGEDYTLTFTFDAAVNIDAMRLMDFRPGPFGPPEQLPSPMSVVAINASGEEILRDELPLATQDAYNEMHFSDSLLDVASIEISFEIPSFARGTLHDVKFDGSFR